MWCGRPHKFVPPHHANPAKGTQLIGRAGAERAAQIVLAPVDQEKLNAAHLHQICRFPNGKAAPGEPPFFLECEGNPTTLIAGNNVLPVTFRDPNSQAVERFPSSAPRMMTTLNRVLFRFLEDIAGQVTGNARAYLSRKRRILSTVATSPSSISNGAAISAPTSRGSCGSSALFCPRGHRSRLFLPRETNGIAIQ